MHGQRPCRLDAGCCGANWPCLNQQAQPDTLTLPLPGGWHDCQWLQCTPSGAGGDRETPPSAVDAVLGCASAHRSLIHDPPDAGNSRVSMRLR